MKTVDGVSMEDVETLAAQMKLSVVITEPGSCQKDGCVVEFKGMFRGSLIDRFGKEKGAIYSDDKLSLIGRLYRKLEVLKQTTPIEPEERRPFEADELIERILAAAKARGEWYGDHPRGKELPGLPSGGVV